MKTLVTLATLLVTASIAAAQSSLTEPAPAPATASTAQPATSAPPTVDVDRYAQLVIDYGGTQGAMYVAPALAGGVRIGSSPLWWHGMVLASSAKEVDESSSTGSTLQVRGGIEARGCFAVNMVCAYAGLDAGLSHTGYTDSNGMATSSTAPMIVPRGGVDFGGDHVRIGPGLELGVTPQGPVAGLTLAFGLQW
ncbi:MAG TPA: hypothetical protein VMJ10_10120 [Kofleriaceae bacterium]|nr:hypothetical protein [Kofleriaceae bacterium]